MKKIVFFNTGWMRWYKGITKNDKLKYGGKNPRKYKTGGEIYNFLPYKNSVYGYVSPPAQEKVNIERLGASNTDKFIDMDLVIWTARNPRCGSVIVGWYKNARVYKEIQFLKSHNRSYFVKSNIKNHVLLPVEERVFGIPRDKNGMGQSHIWYADKSIQKHKKYKEKVLKYINNYRNTTIYKNTPIRKKTRQPDVEIRQKIEKKAIEITKKYYKNRNYKISSVEKDNIGWDLEAMIKNNKLRIEVKGLSGDDISVELTPNEFQSYKKNKRSYRICVVTNALSRNSKLNVFAYSDISKKLEDADGKTAFIEIIKSAKIFQ
jgi:hypothetical protein